MMNAGSLLTLGAVIGFCRVVTTATAQVTAASAAPQPPYPQFVVEYPGTRLLYDAAVVASHLKGKGTTTAKFLSSSIHGMALRGITLKDSTAMKAAVLRQVEQSHAGRPTVESRCEPWPSANCDAVAAEIREKWIPYLRDYYETHLPELRSLMTPEQQEVFDRNLVSLGRQHYDVLDEQGRPSYDFAGVVTREIE